MRTVCLLAGYGPSLINFRSSLIQELVRRQVQVAAIAPEIDPITRSALARMGAEAIDVPLERNTLSPLADLQSLYRLVGILRQLRPDVVLSYTAKSVVWGSIAAALAGVPRRFALITGRGSALDSDSPPALSVQAITERLFRYALRGCENVIFQNADDERFFRARRLLSRDAASTVVNGSGVDLVRFAQQPLASRKAFLMVARLLPAKGVREYLEAARRVKQACPEARFQLAGWFEQSSNAVSRTDLERWNADRQVEFLGRLEDVRPALAHCSVFVLPSYYREGLPRTLLEALAVGRAIITTDHPGCREAVQDGWNGALVQPRDIDGLTTAMMQMVSSPDTVARMARASRELAVRRFDAVAVAHAMVNVLQAERAGRSEEHPCCR